MAEEQKPIIPPIPQKPISSGTPSEKKDKEPTSEELLASLGIGSPETPLKPPPSPPPLPPAGEKPSLQPKLWLGIGIGFLVLVLLTATFFLLRFWLGQKGTLEVSFEPTEVNLTVDSRIKRSGVTQLTLNLSPGDHFLEASKEGYLVREETFVIKKGEATRLDLALKPIPTLSKLPIEKASYPSLLYPGEALLYFDSSSGIFYEFSFKEGKNFPLFEGKKFSGVKEVVWSPVDESALVKLEGNPKLANRLDNSDVRGRYVPLGENPTQGPRLYLDETTWLFDSSRQTASGWQPVKLSDNIRNIAWSADGSEIIYFYTAADGEHSLIRSWEDGSEWSRVMTDLNQFGNLELSWGSFGRYLLARDDSKLYLADLTARIFNEAIPDADLRLLPQWSPDGEHLAYLKKEDKNIGIWSAADNKEVKVKKLDFSVQSLVWRDSSTLIVADTSGNLWLVGEKIKPLSFVATEEITEIRGLYYSVSQPALIIESSSHFYFLPL